MSTKSLWLETNIECDKLENDLSCDVLIIGGGLSGLSVGYYLTKKGKKVVILEANFVGSGASGHTSAHVTMQHDTRCHRFIQNFDLETTKLIAKANMEALDEIRNIVKEHDIECDLEEVDSYLIANEDNVIDELKDEYDSYLKLGINGNLISEPKLEIEGKLALKIPNQLHFNPVKYMKGLVEYIINNGGKIYERSRVLKINDKYVNTDEYKIDFNKLVVATHNPIVNFPGMYFAKVYQDRSYTVAFHLNKKFKAMYNVMDKDGFTYRRYNDYLLVGGMDHQSGKESKVLHFQKIIERNSDLLVHTYWSAQDPITLDLLPYIGHYSKKSDNIYVTTGYGKWGMTNSNIAGRIISDMITGTPNPYIEIYSPYRSKKFRIKMNALRINSLVFFDYMKGLFRFGKPTCPHLKCRMVYNKEENSFDCPCHGSRLDEDGQVIETPAIHSKFKKKDNQK